MLALCLALALLPTDGDGLRFEGSVAAGGGYDSNLLIAPGTDAAGSTIASVSASGGAAIDLSDSAFLYVGAAFDGTKFPALPELDRRTASDPVYGSNIDRVFAEVEFRAARSTWFSESSWPMDS